MQDIKEINKKMEESEKDGKKDYKKMEENEKINKKMLESQ